MPFSLHVDTSKQANWLEYSKQKVGCETITLK